ncbi:MAG: hypothetical protein LKE89_01990 [Lactobacillaceae bacterium]|jgi:hypothetical protein|nr:hypothetical protein [Lactobacillaceae bacterium]
MDIQSRANHTIDGNINENKKKSFIEKAKEHKKEIAIGAVAILSVVTIVLVVKNKTTIEAAIKSTHTKGGLANSLKTRNNVAPTISEVTPTNIPSNAPIVEINVRGHIRNLPEGWNPSASNKEAARNLGYCLDEHQTWVNPYTKIAA